MKAKEIDENILNEINLEKTFIGTDYFFPSV